MRVVGRRLQADGFDGLRHRPVAFARDQRGGGLHHRVAAGGQALVQQRVKAVGVELADGEIGGIGKVHHDDIKRVRSFLQPAKCIGVDDLHLGVLQRVAVELRKARVLAEDLRHGRVQLHQRHGFDRGVLEDLAHGHAVAAAQHRHLLGRAVGGHGGVHQGLVVAVLVGLRKLQVAIEVQPVARAPLRDHDALVGRRSAEDDAVLVELVFGHAGDLLGPRQRGQQDAQHHHAGRQVRLQAPQLVPKQPHRPQRHGRIHHAKQQPRADEPQVRHQEQRKRHRHRQRAQVVKREHLRDQVLERHVALQDAHHQGDLQPHQRAHHQHHAVQQKPESAGRVRIGQEQRGWQGSANQRHQQFDAQEVRGQLPLEVPRQPRAHAHGKQVGADDGGKLQHRIAQHIRRQRARSQLVQQAAGGHHEHADEQGDFDGAGAGGGARGLGRRGRRSQVGLQGRYRRAAGARAVSGKVRQ